eukprot:CAMPEP_0198154512 /NCGR_PEP_ID=MMETSP1443-20131203/68635_1 /TAXON_ID=186043 /ORGANISM="Entomoneis sp., Strain CCMP2396" /LENGTH=129 /DNA_ID=CAMNT_0043821191 /DNA_START=497 /DNA_END=886 /DNA_ORIENTATION=-
MSWFGGGSSGGNEGSSEKSFAPDAGAASFSSSSQELDLGGGGGNAMAELQQAGMAIQQQMLIQQVITELAEKSFNKCITTTKDPKLSSREISCIQAATNKWLDASEMLHGRQQKKEQQALSSQQQGGFA